MGGGGAAEEGGGGEGGGGGGGDKWSARWVCGLRREAMAALPHNLWDMGWTCYSVQRWLVVFRTCPLYTSDAADDPTPFYSISIVDIYTHKN